MSLGEPLFIHPLLAADDRWAAYQVEFAPGHGNSELISALCIAVEPDHFGLQTPWFLPAPADMADFGKLNAVSVSPPVEASSADRKIAFIAPDGNLAPNFPPSDYLIVHASQARSIPPAQWSALAGNHRLIASQVLSYSDRQWLIDHRVELSTDEFLLTRQPCQKTADMARMRLLKLLALLAEDADTSVLNEVFREEPKLAYSLLRMVNSPAVSPHGPISSLSQAIMLLGRRQIQRWLQLLAYALPDEGGRPNPLLQKAAWRGRLLELLARQLTRDGAGSRDDLAFLVGAFSLLDVLLDLKMRDLMPLLPLPALCRDALVAHDGNLGQLLDIIEATDRRDFTAAAKGLAALNIAPQAFMEAQLQALAWAAHLDSGAA